MPIAAIAEIPSTPSIFAFPLKSCTPACPKPEIARIQPPTFHFRKFYFKNNSLDRYEASIWISAVVLYNSRSHETLRIQSPDWADKSKRTG